MSSGNAAAATILIKGSVDESVSSESVLLLPFLLLI
jgi:hypothetical protein